MKVVSSKICPFVQRVTAMLEAKNWVYDIEYINLDRKPEWFLEISPNGQVPVLLTDDNNVIFESDAIVEYIEEIIPEPPLFGPSPLMKAQQRAWSYLATKNYLLQCSAQRSHSREILEERAGKLRVALAKLEKQLSGAKYFGGPFLGIVDIAWLPLLHRAAIIAQHSGYDFIADFAKVQALQKNILGTSLPEKSVSPDFEEKFRAFYLSTDTYLGQLASGEASCCSHKAACCS